MYQGCIMRNMRTSCGSRTFPESSNSEGSRRSGLTLRPAASVPKPYPAACRVSGSRPPPAFRGLRNQEADYKVKVGWKRDKAGSEELEERSV